MMREIPAPGYTLTPGTRAPRKAWGERLFIQLRTMGWCPPDPYPVATCNFIHTGSGADIVAVKREELT